MMKSSFSNLKLKINTNLKSFKRSHHSPVPQTDLAPPALSTISESASLNYPDPNKNEKNNRQSSCASSVASPITPQSPPAYPSPPPQSPKDHVSIDPIAMEVDEEYDVKQVLRSHGYRSLSKIASTLQGEIYKANTREKEKNKHVVIKVTNKALHERSIAMVDGQEISIQENIVDEIRILRWLTLHDAPPSMTRFIDYFHDDENIFLVMEDGGMDFFKFVAECHKLINSKVLSLEEWQCAVQVLFKQMVQFVDWMHTEMAVCHLDISLENLLITDVFVMSEQGPNGQPEIYLSHNFQIKFCDFGLSTAFDGKDFRCNKYVGKTGYKAPKVYGKKKVFDARAADIWSLGVVFFMMTIGAPPFRRASMKEYGFELIIGGKMDELLESWDRMEYLTPPMFDLLQRMLRREEKRITMEELRNHPWLQ